ncbi:hypothetical protein CXG53_00090 [Pseudomonas guariconensis]|uniref:Secreted protein n=1 Tax=Pseudomonas guariconensis TaxID=1288410 RepID=A0AAX0W1J8_9PSED|nr:hypothetical protein CXG49_00090 [Pseudomonas guariconensis]PLV25865.1 hypothetical protein CXG53_00090 [Pseudomonas guariconensis]PLV30943.1 hypothetical protein CXG51_00090 [Pseudomonas guariconensis]
MEKVLFFIFVGTTRLTLTKLREFDPSGFVSPYLRAYCTRRPGRLLCRDVQARPTSVLIVSKLLMRVIKAHARWRWRA